MMSLAKTVRLAAVLGASLLAGAGARAEQVTYFTSGVFTGGDNPGSSTYLDAANGVSIVFNSSGINTVDAVPFSLTSFGTFDTSATTATGPVPVVTDFTLTIIQTAPAPGGSISFESTLTGTLQIDASQLFVQFDQPLMQNIGLVSYEIVSADTGVPGRVNIAPPTTNNGVTTIAGRITAVPEPASMAMLGMGAVGLLGYARRRKAQATA